MVETVPHPVSARARLVRPTAQGQESIRLALQTFDEAEDRLRSHIGSQAVDQMRRALESDWGDQFLDDRPEDTTPDAKT